MKHWMKKTAALGLALSLTLGQAALASDALGHDLHGGSKTISQGAELTRNYFWSDTYSDLRTERYITYTPNQTVTPQVVYGSNLLERKTLSAMARDLESQGQRVVGGVNGDFYVLSTGQPLGVVITDGVLRSSSSYHPAVGFLDDGTAFVGYPQLQVSAVMLGERITVFGGVNKVRSVRTASGGGLVLLSEDFGANTQNTAPGVDVFLKPVVTDEELGSTLTAYEAGLDCDVTLSNELRVGSRVKCVVDYVSEAAGANPIPRGGFVLTMNGKDDEGTLNMLRSLQPGDSVDIDITAADERWNEVTQAVGGMYRLLDNGVVGQGMSSERTARTAIGVRPDGSVLLYTVDGKQPGVSIGATCAQVAQRLLELGCVDALGLDGGGSTTLGLTAPENESMVVANNPSEGSQRANSVAVFLTTTLPATGQPGYLQVEPGDALVMSGTRLPLSAYVVDTGYRLTSAATDVTYTLSGAGTVENGVFVAGAESGTTRVTATQGKLTGSATVTTVATPDTILVTNELTGASVGALSLDPGQSVALRASAVWRKLPLQSQDSCYTWACDEAIGTITADGAFTAGDVTAEGEITVTAGEKTLAIPVSVAGHILPVEDMEGDTLRLRSGEGAELTPETDLANVHTGRRSLRVEYDMTGTGLAVIDTDITIPEGEKYLGLWVRGDDSMNALTAVFADGEEEALTAVCGLGFTGWKHILIPVPEGMTELKNFQFLYGGGESAQGTVWLDQITCSNEAIEDDIPPVINLTVTGDTLTASVSDNVDRSFSAAGVVAQYDGATLPGQWDEKTSTLTVQLPEAGVLSHRITVTAADVSGNLGRASYDIPGESVMVFADMQDHWAASYAGYLYDQGISRGVSEGEIQNYQPAANITRAEFFTMVARWMGLELEEYEGVELPFGDADEVPQWARPAVAAMYQKGIVQGSLDNGILYLRPNSGINRAEVMTILGRTQQKGYPEAELGDYADAADIPAWCEGYVRSLVGQKIVNGYEDATLRPMSPMTRGEVAKVLYALR